MSGFDLASLLPCYLDESDEQIAALNAALLTLEQDPNDEKSLREAFRMVHSLKGSSTVMGFDPVKDLTHHLETYFDHLRSRRRSLERPFLDLCFRCLDGLRDFHIELRSQGHSDQNLSALTLEVLDMLQEHPAGQAPKPPAREPEAAATVPAAQPPEPAAEAPKERPRPAPPVVQLPGQQGVVCVTVMFEPGLPWPDMKAKLILTRLGAKGRVIVTSPPADQLDEIETLQQLSVWFAADCDIDEIHTLASVDGVTEIRVDSLPLPSAIAQQDIQVEPPPVRGTPAQTQPRSEQKPKAAPEQAPAAIAPPSSPAPATATADPPPPKKPRVAETVRVDVDRLDQLMNLAGELVINKARFFEIAKRMDEMFRGINGEVLATDTLDRLDGIARAVRDGGAHAGDEAAAVRWSSQLRRLRENFRTLQGELELVRQGRDQLVLMTEAVDHLARISDGIQKGVLETRMVPIGPLFDRFHRIVRDLRVTSNKEVNLRIAGDNTELDKRMIDELADPLVHLVRNAVDHGLEVPEAREASGKPRSGTVSLSASHRGNSVVVTVGDDGHGIDCERVRRKAVSQGLIGEAESRRLTERQLIQFIWHPGLSTAEKITDISGRGVGMDIVKSRIESLNGTLDVRTELGQGTTFTLRLPLTLAIMPVLLARIGEVAYAIPLDHLNEIVEVRTDQIRRVNGKKTIGIRGRVIALISLDDVFRWSGGRTSGALAARDDESGKLTVVIVSNGEDTMGLVVDELIGMQEAVLKSLERNFRSVPGLSGASILGDGRVSLILDIDALVEMVMHAAAKAVG